VERTAQPGARRDDYQEALGGIVVRLGSYVRTGIVSSTAIITTNACIVPAPSVVTVASVISIAGVITTAGVEGVIFSAILLASAGRTAYQQQ
jgi:hypothetical protein